jgi:hypothetical protein
MTQQLYYQNLDNNAGVFCRLVDEAEDEETKEALLAYFFLWQHARDDWTPGRLGESIGAALRRFTGEACGFEVREAIAKLERLGLLAPVADGLRVIEPSAALHRLADRLRQSVDGEFLPQ